MASDLHDISAGMTLHKNTLLFSRLSDFLQVPNQFFYKRYLQKVINRPYADVIENYDDVVAAVKGSAFAPLTDSI